MFLVLCIASTIVTLLYLREIIDIGLIVLLFVGVERMASLMGGFDWEECVIFIALLLPVGIFFLRVVNDSQDSA